MAARRGSPNNHAFLTPQLRSGLYGAASGWGESSVRKIEDYRKHAEECRAMANRAASDEHRQMLLQMVETWESLARDRAEQIACRKRIVELDSVPNEGS